MFSGFSDDTFEFLMALGFNNNREFFHANHDWYMRALRKPALELAAELGKTVNRLSMELETRPEKVVSRINRDLRFTNDKTPYREYIWLAFRRPGEQRNTTMGAYFDLNCAGASYGIGIYAENRPLMNGLRRRLRTDPEELMKLLPKDGEFTAHVDSMKRMPLPEGLPEELAPWYRAKSFYIEKDIKNFSQIKSAKLAGEIINGYTKLETLFRYMDSLIPEEDVK